jgi:ribosome biogenesis GTPase
MQLKDLGYTKELEEYTKEEQLNAFEIGRVLAEHKERYVVMTEEQEYEAEIIGQLRFSAQSRADFPAVGDWVAVSAFDENKALIHRVLPRKNSIDRQSVNKYGEKQIIASNIDYAFILQAVGHDFNVNRIERYLTICFQSRVKPLILINKIDLLQDEELEEILKQVKSRIVDVPVFAISNLDGRGLVKVMEHMQKGKTYCLLGSSGVGKSSLLNRLSGKELMKTSHISDSTKKGRHVTTHRELHILPNGSILIDNPGMREVGIADAAEGIGQTFEKIMEFANRCKFKDCSHSNEIGCAVLEALETGVIDAQTYENYHKLEKEKAFFDSTQLEKRKKDRAFGKMVRQVKKIKKK